MIAAPLHLARIQRASAEQECARRVERCCWESSWDEPQTPIAVFFTLALAMTTVLHRFMRVSTLRSALLVPFLASLFFLSACQILGNERPSTDQPSRDTAARQAEREAREAEAARNAAEEKAKQERERAARAALEEKKKEESLRNCCLALAKTGFEERSMELMAATDVCEAAQKEQKTLEGIRDELIAPLGKRSLPAACAP